MSGEPQERLREVYDASYRRLVGQLYGVCGNLAEAEDVVQEAFVRAAHHRAKFERVDNPEAWLRTVALNLARTRHRRRIVGERLIAKTRPDTHHPELSPDHVAVVTAMKQLPHAQREAIALHHLVDLPVDDVALAVGVSANTIKTRLRRGRTALAALLADHEEASHA